MSAPADLEASRFLRACRGRPVDRVPIWVMRQAGRYLPEYREVRGRTTFLGLCKTPDLAAEVTVQPVRRFGVDAAIIFSDILIPVEAMGMELVFDEGPSLPNPLRSGADVDKLGVPDPIDKMQFVMDAIRIVRRELPATPLIGFAGAPFTLASYMVEGGGSRNYERTKVLMYEQPRVWRALGEKLARTIARHLMAQVEAGAAAVQIFDSWAGALSPDDYFTYALPFTLEIIDALRPSGVPVILFARGVHAAWSALAGSGAQVLGVDWTSPLDQVRAATGGRVALQGNLDPVALLGPLTHIERQVQRVINEGRGGAHIFNLGHGILPGTPVEHMSALVDAVRRFGVERVPPDLAAGGAAR
jgi:uroporphyrinogen decarboxylase